MANPPSPWPSPEECPRVVKLEIPVEKHGKQHTHMAFFCDGDVVYLEKEEFLQLLNHPGHVPWWMLTEKDREAIRGYAREIQGTLNGLTDALADATGDESIRKLKREVEVR